MPPDPSDCLPPPHPDCRFIVGIPARDEASRIGASLDAFARQRRRDGRPFSRERFEVIVLANNCADDTAETARAVAARHAGLRVHVVEAELSGADAHVGTARRWVMEAARRRLAEELGHPRGIIATTDADSRVSPEWLDATEREMGRGAEAVGGYIRACAHELALLPEELRAFGRQIVEYNFLVARWEDALDPRAHDPWPRHFHHNGASLAVTAQAYALVGGMPALPAFEDMKFHAALVRHDVPVRHSPAVRVITSARTVGRTPLGMAVTIGEWIEALRAGRTPCLVESPAAIERRIFWRRALRRRWQAARTGEAFGIFAERFPAPDSPGGLVEVSTALAALRRRLGLTKVIRAFPAASSTRSRRRSTAAEHVEAIFSSADAA